MNQRIFIIAGVGLAAVGAMLLFTLGVQRGAHLRLEGGVAKVRTQATGDSSAVAVLDFRIKNGAGIPFVVREVIVESVKADGTIVEGRTVSDRDAERFLTAYPLMGPKFNPSLVIRDKLAPGATEDRMIAAAFDDVPEVRIKQSKLRIKITEADGLEFRIE